MASRVDLEIQQLEKLVEMRLNLCKVTCDGARCTLPANHDQGEPHRFGISAR